jgi:adenylylsulfate kinase
MVKRINYGKDKSLWTDFNNFIRRNRRRFLVKQRPVVIWLTGLSGAGKTTIAEQLNTAILRKGYFTKHFDGDEIRKGINNDLNYTEADRHENIRRISEVSKLFLDSGLVIICSFISPTANMRNMAREIIGSHRFIEVFVNCPFEVCEQRDPKGLYKMARAGLITNFTGIDSPYEPPKHAEVEIRTDLWDIPASTKYILRKVLPKIKFRQGWFLQK